MFHDNLANCGGYGLHNPIRASKRGTRHQITGLAVAVPLRRGIGCRLLKTNQLRMSELFNNSSRDNLEPLHKLRFGVMTFQPSWGLKSWLPVIGTKIQNGKKCLFKQKKC
uniref:Uncharacterized protein n=1 Tax=Ixodes ricinus TaxID=34613 RepID=A0A6B0UJ02_IXORI